LVEHECNIVESQQFTDRGLGRFFMRVQSNRRMSTRWICRRCAGISVRRRISSAWRGGLLAAAQKQRVLVLVSKFGHCLNDLLFRTANGALNIKIAAVVLNHAS
jgi:formyltetrahydrofolate deformylase